VGPSGGGMPQHFPRRGPRPSCRRGGFQARPPSEVGDLLVVVVMQRAHARLFSHHGRASMILSSDHHPSRPMTDFSFPQRSTFFPHATCFDFAGVLMSSLHTVWEHFRACTSAPSLERFFLHLTGRLPDPTSGQAPPHGPSGRTCASQKVSSAPTAFVKRKRRPTQT